MKKPVVAVKEFKKNAEMGACPYVKFTHNAECIVGINCDGYVGLWNTETKELVKKLQLPKAHYGPNVWISTDRLTVAVQGSGSTVFINTKTLEVLFAVTDHGDAFYFDTTRGKPDYEVRKHDHEVGSFEPYASNFAECIKRFAGG